LLDTHLLLAGLFHNERLKLADEEGERLAETIGRVIRWYDIPAISERAADHYAFAMAAIMIWGTRIMTEINERKKARGAPTVIRPVSQASPAPQAAAGEPNPGNREPPDPREWRRVDVDGVGPIDIPPVGGTVQ
jgi:hypothetical protein